MYLQQSVIHFSPFSCDSSKQHSIDGNFEIFETLHHSSTSFEISHSQSKTCWRIYDKKYYRHQVDPWICKDAGLECHTYGTLAETDAIAKASELGEDTNEMHRTKKEQASVQKILECKYAIDQA